MKHISLKQNTPEWLEYRKKGIGASDAPIILGCSIWKTPYQLWLEKLGFASCFETNDAIERGKNLEESARHVFTSMTGVHVFPSVIESKDYPWMFASLDGISLNDSCMVEIKCPGKKDHEIAMSGSVPEKYYPQLQHQLAVSGLEEMYYFSFDGIKGKILTVKRSEEYINDMIEKEREFYRCINEIDPPKLTDRDYSERDDLQWHNAVISWLKRKNYLKQAEIDERNAREQLINLCGFKNTKGAGIKIQKIIRKGSINYSCIPELKDINLDLYRESSKEIWRICEI